MTYKVKICVMCGKEFVPNSGAQKYCEECNSVVRKEYLKQWRFSHLKHRKEYQKQWNKTHSKYKKEWNKAHPEHKKQWNKVHPEYLKQWAKDNPDRFKAIRKKRNSKCRQLGFIPLNELFEGSEAHHIDKERVIYIPKKLHRSIYHNNFTGQGMDKINTLAVQWYITQVMKETHKYLI